MAKMKLSKNAKSARLFFSKLERKKIPEVIEVVRKWVTPLGARQINYATSRRPKEYALTIEIENIPRKAFMRGVGIFYQIFPRDVFDGWDWEIS